jgi:hypothetical protein
MRGEDTASMFRLRVTNARPGYDVKPLVATAMTVSRAAFGRPGRDPHFRRLCLLRAVGDAKSLPESKRFAFMRCDLDVSPAEGSLHAVERSSTTPAGE